MCHHCDYSKLLGESGLGYTPNRHRVFEVVGNNNSPLSAQQIFDTLSRTDNINRVTVYRILDLLVDNGLVDRISGGGGDHSYTVWRPMKTTRPILTFTVKAAVTWNV